MTAPCPSSDIHQTDHHRDLNQRTDYGGEWRPARIEG
jgi:hypothetical protein